MTIGPSFSDKGSLSGVLRRLVMLSGHYPDLELVCSLRAGTLKVGIPRGINGDEFEAALQEMPLGQPLTDEVIHLAATMTDGRFVRCVAPLVRNAAGKYEAVMAIIYNKAGMPIELFLSGEGKQVPVAEWQPMQEL